MDWFWFALASAVFISIETILEKKILKKEHSLQFSTTLAIAIFFLSLIFLPYLNLNNLSLKDLILLYFNSWLAAISFLLVSKSIRHMEISLVSPFLSLGPVLVLIFSLFFLKESVTNVQIFGIFLVVFGTYVLQSNKENYFSPIKEMVKSKYIHYILIALILNGFSATLDRYFLKDNLIDPVSYLVSISALLAVNYCILILVLHGGFKEINSGFRLDSIKILIMAGLLILSRLSLFQSFSMASAFLVEPVKRASVLFVIIFGGTLLHEKYLFKKFIASLFILAGIYLIAR